MTPSDISVIIPAINEADRIGRAISSALDTGAGEVTVVDGGSRDATTAVAHSAGAKVISSPAGRAIQQNRGALASRGAVFLFLHADNWLHSACAQQIATALPQHPRRWGGAFQQRIDSPRWSLRLIAWGDSCRVRWRGLPFGDQGIFIRRCVFEQVGGFPEEPLMEDLLLAARLRRIAWPLLLPGPVHVDPRRWDRHGPLRQTARNFSLQLRHAWGATPSDLARDYPRHDAPQ